MASRVEPAKAVELVLLAGVFLLVLAQNLLEFSNVGDLWSEAVDVAFWAGLVFFTAVGNTGARKLLIFLLMIGGILGVGVGVYAHRSMGKSLDAVAPIALLSACYLFAGCTFFFTGTLARALGAKA